MRYLILFVCRHRTDMLQSRCRLLSKEVKITNIIAAGIAYNIMLKCVMFLV